ncbi:MULTISPECIES: D-alanyl-D-alanine carboxypeptidase [Asticcacaulis]|uniref:D-alanyl-D-alanine carboxypeptidase n=1 Tax=Asticcacaulis TaxID=76890 RepID=UPI001AE31BCC|nr:MULTISPECIES: D-alanyl-D-alanine carboxypeptidase [Asticcacaulis]MBP2160742.1 D-alanyl-D-alanine carboxypeptidase (penicillin-binding protein 5/6) [Asticcacaulis solisilvae]MDR6801787.1 D-alanyl-D-alanine carboxypeptidase (penicillin-binding protein 5/6) [Asticcacaulis sp. BE141]
MGNIRQATGDIGQGEHTGNGASTRQTAFGIRNGLVAFLAAAAALTVPAAVQAQNIPSNSKYAAIVVDAQSGEVLYANRADSVRYPASLTKIMTLYMVFDALAQGKLKPTDTITISQRAASQSPVKVYLKPGDTIDVDTAMRLTALYSANDLAVALAEKVGGTEERFAALMTIRAQSLGMTNTRFTNANGLPDARQLSSARDMAILARAVMRDYPQYYSYFNVESMQYRGRTYVNHNPLKAIPGVDGLKTGFTNASGYNLVASQVKGNHRLVTVMLGGANKLQRREHVTDLMEVGFDVMERRARGEVITVAQAEFTRKALEPKMPDGPTPYTLLASNSNPLTDSQLREALEDSEEANATDIDVQRVSAMVKAPDVVQALTQDGQSDNTGPQPYLALKAAVAAPAYEPIPQVAHATEEAPKPVKVVNRSEANKAAAIEANRKALAEKTTATKTADKKKADAKTKLAAADDEDDDKKSAKGKKAKKNAKAQWAVQVGAFKDKSMASDWVRSVKMRFDDALADGTSQVSKNENGWYRTRFADLTKEQAEKACKSMSAKRLDCMVIKPNA